MNWIVRRRGTPNLFVCDRSCETLFSTPGLADSENFQKSKRLLSRLFSEALPESEIFEALDENVVLRILPLTGSAGYYAVFLETHSERKSLEAAAALYGLTKREVEVLGLVLRGHSTIQIAESLFISVTTVGDHMKSLLRKTKTNRRTALVARIFSIGENRGDDAGEPAEAIAVPERSDA
jgi:DNA-binding CsgD family transcriptional regulator